jgi:hypothetical protein
MSSSPIRLEDVVDAFEFVSVSEFGENQAYICRATGRIFLVSDTVDPEDDDWEVPDDPEAQGYCTVPHRRELDLGKRVAIAFAAEALPDYAADVWQIFSRRGAYRRFKDFLDASGMLDKCTYHMLQNRRIFGRLAGK